MQSPKSRIIGVVVLLVMVCAIVFIPQIKAEEAPTTTVETVTELTCEDLADKYGLKMEKNPDVPNQFDLIKDPTLHCDGTIHKDVSVKILSINGTGLEHEVILTSTNNKYTFSASFLGPIDENVYYVSVVVGNVDNPDEIIDVRYEEIREPAGGGTVSKENDHWYGLCKTYQDTAEPIGTEKYSFFKTALPYCFDPSPVINYTATELQSKIDSIMALWNSYQNQSSVGSLDFNTVFNDTRAKAKKIPTHTISNPLTTTLTLKCAYDRVKTGAHDVIKTYTNEYGETIQSTEYYLNKDYYYSYATTVDGEVKYVYNFAPGHTVTDTQQACERTCEEAVKVEYGPPIASKAGLCFEYKVKVTSYVKCTSKVIAKEPEKFDSYCNPAPICYSKRGTLRDLEQAGPKEEFDSCISSCDGGKYTEKCSVKCYNEVYGKENPKLAINYEDAVLSRTAMVTDTSLYSQAQCMKDNAEKYFGCYVYNGNEIEWLSDLNYDVETVDGKDEVVKKDTAWNRRYALGRWYIDRVYKKNDGTYRTEWDPYANYVRGRTSGYKITGIKAKCKDDSEKCDDSDSYIADEHGVYRANRNGSLCGDICHWRYVGDAEHLAGNTTGLCKKTLNSVKENDYLNPGTLEKDAIANQKAYEDAVRSCIGTATCSEHTAEFSISLTYDTTTNEVKKQNTVTFPYNTGPDTLTANKDNNIADKSRSILSYTGCYANKNAANNYMTEWSFPGTYIHNKTGEISFKRPDVTDGWYYDDKKFCMPLDADSVNVKWWEWYKLVNTCYTCSEIESELAGKTGTSNGYNISAKAKKFGYFGWNFDINCFYGLRNEMCNVNKDGCCAPATKESNGVSNYTFRSVATNNLFPNAKAENVIDPDKRDIGFNWTSKALSMKNDDYVVDPVKLIEHIENGAAGLYSNDSTNLDYQFYLTPATLAKIKSYNNNNDYASWNGTVDLVNGIKVYQSNLFRNVGSHTKVLSDIPSSIIELGLPGVNNECYRSDLGTTECSVGKK